VKNTLALRRYGEKREIGEAVLFLCSASAEYITGTVLDCDGGAGLAISAVG
jgi:NAD(P)-dependent dehydrogenase (short-subunit alcohol dehydrogenase family)